MGFNSIPLYSIEWTGKIYRIHEFTKPRTQCVLWLAQKPHLAANCDVTCRREMRTLPKEIIVKQSDGGILKAPVIRALK